MPRGSNPNSRANLIKNSELTPKERKDKAKKAGKKSGEVRRAQATLTETLKSKCTPETLDEITSVLIGLAKGGNLKAYELLRDQIGEKPIETLAVSAKVNDEAVTSLKDAITQRRNAD